MKRLPWWKLRLLHRFQNRPKKPRLKTLLLANKPLNKEIGHDG
jgi:hypothetical protein